MNSLLFLFIAAGLGVSFFLSGMEAGVFALSRVRIRRLMRAGHGNARRLNRYLEQPEEFLWTILAGNFLANFGVASLVVVGSREWLRQYPWWFAGTFFVGTVLFYAFCELLPKMLFRMYPNRLCLWLSGPFALVHLVLRPLVKLLRWLASGLLRWTGGQKFAGRLFGTREELRVLMQESSKELTSEERGMINRVLDLQNLTVSHVLVPMARAVTVTTETPVTEALDLCRERGLSRLPVWRTDQPSRIAGVFNLKSLLYRADLDLTKKVGDYVRPATFVDADTRLEEAMRHLQRAGQRLAIVLGRDGREAGIVSLQDLLKAIFGGGEAVNLDEVISIFWRLLSVLVLVFINGFFVAAEFALVKIRDTQLQPLIQRGNRRARIARQVVRNLDRSLSAAQLGITLASLGLGWIGEPVFAKLLEPLMTVLNVHSLTAQHTISFIVGFTLITFLHIVVGEQAPKWLAIQKPLPTALWVSGPLQVFNYVAYPFIWMLNGSSHWFLRQLGINAEGEAELVHSEEELRLLVATSERTSGAGGMAREILLNAFDLRQRVAREVMRPRREIVVLDVEDSLPRDLEVAEQTRFSRFPLVEEGNLDRALGYIHVKDLFAARDRALNARELLPLAKKLVYVPETARLERLLQIFLDRKVHMALVVDEYGGTVGLLTMENILEELVGQIQDEFDQEKPLLVKKGPNSWSVDGGLPLHELAELTGEPMNEEGVTTASGWITHRVGGFPKRGDVIQVGPHELRVEEMDGARVARLQLNKVPEMQVTDPA